MSTAGDHERRHDRLAIAEAYVDYLDGFPNGLEYDLFGMATVFENAPLAMIQCSLACQVDLLERLSRDGLLLVPPAPPEEKP